MRKILKIAIALFAVVILLGFIASIMDDSDSDSGATESDKKQEEIVEDESDENRTNNSVKAAYVGLDNKDFEADIYGESIGVSDKSFGTDCDATVNLMTVRNDSTGNWEIMLIAEDIEISEYALNLFGDNAADDETVIFVVNFSKNTTTSIKYLGGSLVVDTYEYVDGEEHDANKLVSGTLLQEYAISVGSGRVYKVQ